MLLVSKCKTLQLHTFYFKAEPGAVVAHDGRPVGEEHAALEPARVRLADGGQVDGSAAEAPLSPV